MAINIATSSKSEDSTVAISNDPGQETLSLQEVQNSVEVQKHINAISDMPGSENTPGTVNWLGSSYTGQDIKVLAHLYSAIDHESELASLEATIGDLQDLHDALSAFTANVATVAFASPDNAREIYEDQNDFIAAGGDGAFRNPGPFLQYHLAFLQDPGNTYLGMRGDIEIIAGQIEGYESRRDSLGEVQEKGTATLPLGNLQTLSFQVHRDKFPVRAFGHAYPKGFVRGNRMLAGSMIFAVFNEHAVAQLISKLASNPSKYTGERDAGFSSLLSDQLPPLDITISFANEYGSVSVMTLYGLEFVNDSMTFSVEDLLTEEVMQFVVRDFDPMVHVLNRELALKQRAFNQSDSVATQSASQLILGSKDAYNDYLGRLNVRRKLTSR